MAKIDYVARETASNLRRNLLMTSAAVLTVTVSLALVGGALLLRQGVSNATVQWRGGVELSIFLKPDVTESQRNAIKRRLEAMPQVKSERYVDQKAAKEEFDKIFHGDPTIANAVGYKDLPPSFRVVPYDASQVQAVGQPFTSDPGVMQNGVVYADKQIKTLLRVTRALQVGILVVAAMLLLSAAVLILNTIRMAIYSRRREVAVMKLVGATNWFVRVPFMFEGLIQGLAGAAVAFAAVYLGRNVLQHSLQNSQLFQQFYVSRAEVLGTGIFILAVGAIVGALGSAIAVRRFLDV